MNKRKYSVLFYVPNLIGYMRLLFLITAWIFYDNIYVFLPFYAAAAFLDGIDGWAARMMGQCSAFGAWLDVLVDNVGRSLLWTKLYPLWCIKTHILQLLSTDENHELNILTRDLHTDPSN
ncbi:CDP-diacylglycerol--inositol 3-phosphatidyltransferase 1 [Geodia barretti]|uniref:CDP-diacylglycerol--inositol 3-phosphatidyltransferase 1 n=1 Tax=Geodia barretti TaxID=519541 RepID=A0AA35WR28_GEOBA|nr:CDP-diacylglycerol--inositol 3-phosphatidyltransferase 1 [Geodia barretti]